MEIQGKIIEVCELKQGVSQKTGNAFQSQDFVLETIEQYPKHMVFNVFGSELLSRLNIQKGLEYKVYFNIDAKEYKGRWFNSVRAYDARQVGEIPPIPVKVHKADGTTEVQGMPFPGAENDSNLGF